MLIEYNGKKEEWNNAISNYSEFDYYSLYEWGEYKKKENWIIKRYKFINKNDENLYFQLLIKKKFFLKLIWIPGGLLGKIDNNINELIGEFKKLFKGFFIVRISFSKKFKDSDYKILKQNFTKINNKSFANKTMLLTLPNTTEELKIKLSRNWRHNYKRSLKYKNKIVPYNSKMFNNILEVYKDMENNKNIAKIYSPYELNSLLNCMNDYITTRVILNDNNDILSFRSVLIYKNKAWDFLAATSSKGRKNYSSYFNTFEILKHCIQEKVNNYDLSGIDMENNIGVYNFKKGTGSFEIKKLGLWHYSNSYIINKLIKFINF